MDDSYLFGGKSIFNAVVHVPYIKVLHKPLKFMVPIQLTMIKDFAIGV